jgi:hypothetical protein
MQKEMRLFRMRMVVQGKGMGKRRREHATHWRVSHDDAKLAQNRHVKAADVNLQPLRLRQGLYGAEQEFSSPSIESVRTAQLQQTSSPWN